MFYKVSLFFLFIFADIMANPDTNIVEGKNLLYSYHQNEYDLIYDQCADKKKRKRPKRFRTTKDVLAKNTLAGIDLEGYRDLKLSGSAQYNKSEWIAILKDLTQKYQQNLNQIYVIDLREEPHLFINDCSVTLSHKMPKSDVEKFDPFLNIHSDDVQIFEQDLFHSLKNKNEISIYKVIKKRSLNKNEKYKSHKLKIKNIMTEGDFIQSEGAHYIRFSVTDHRHPSDHLIDEFLNFLANIPKDSWLHFHCRGGVGRTSSFMLLVDIINNGKKIPLDILIKRNTVFGGSKKLFDLTQTKEEKIRNSIARRDFLVQFYDYVNDPNGYGKTIWSTWVKLKEKKSVALCDKNS